MNKEQKWQLVLARDARLDGSFVYAVHSTGIYCRPSCASRRPRKEQVVFFPSPEAAEHAGFRPCRRCLPEKATPTNPQVERVRRACQYIEAHPEDRITLGTLSAHLGGSPYHLLRIFKRIVGVTPRQYADARRLERVKTKMKERPNVTHALYEAGYGSSSRLYERAPRQLGMTPRTYRKGGFDIRIEFTLIPCPLGRLLLAATEQGVCRISFGDDDASLEKSLRREYPAAKIRRDDGRLQHWAEAIREHLGGWQPHLDLPLDVRATAFQRRVWEMLRSLPYGSTRSYAEVARALGQPKATRAVARACAANPAPLLIPCHRVVRKDGRPGGYRWGVARKQALLALERAAFESSGSKVVKVSRNSAG